MISASWPSIARICAIVICSCVIIVAGTYTLGIWCAIALAVALPAAGMIGLKWRYFVSAVQSGDGERTFSFSGGTTAALFAASIIFLAFREFDRWPAFVSIVLFTGYIYFLAGKLGCFSFRCCEGSPGILRLPFVEFAGAAICAIISLSALLLSPPLRLTLLGAALALFAGVRLYSRHRRGQRPAKLFFSSDTAGLAALAAVLCLVR